MDWTLTHGPASTCRLRREDYGSPRLISVIFWLGCLLSAAPAHALKLEVKVEGLKGQEQANVLALLGIYQERADPDLTVLRLESLHRQAPEQIRDALAPFGRYRVAVTDRLDQPAKDKGVWRATYRVDPGERVKITSIDYLVTGEGEKDPAFPKEFPMRVGDVLMHAAYEKAKSDIRYAATSKGYLDYQLTSHQVLVDPTASQAHIQFHLETGPQYRLGTISFKQDLLDERLLRRYVDLKPGEVYDPDRLLALQSRLLGTEYYADVEIQPLKDEAGLNHEVPLQVVATRNKANKYRIGLGYATDAGPRLSMDWRRRYLNRWGHKSRTELSLAPALSSLELDYRIPIQDPTRDYVIIKPQSINYETATRKGWVHSVQVAHSTLAPSGWRRNLGVDYRYEDVDLNDESSGATIELVPNVTWSKTVSDDPVNTSNGYRIKYSLLGAVQGLVSESSFLSGQIQFKWVRRFARQYRFITRTDLGATLAESVDDLPAGRRFYAGGDNSIRGWGFDALGPNDADTDETVGGRYLAVGSLELERQITGPWSAAVFTDFGNAFDPDYEQQFAQSVGFGVRWASPIGQVRFDLAFALTKDQGDDAGGFPPARLHVVIGPDL
jgi:translocation and assembly module TamA